MAGRSVSLINKCTQLLAHKSILLSCIVSLPYSSEFI